MKTIPTKEDGCNTNKGCCSEPTCSDIKRAKIKEKSFLVSSISYESWIKLLIISVLPFQLMFLVVEIFTFKKAMLIWLPVSFFLFILSALLTSIVAKWFFSILGKINPISLTFWVADE